MNASQRSDLRPVCFARAVDHHAGDPCGAAGRNKFRLTPAEAFVVQMIVGVVVPHDNSLSGRSRTGDESLARLEWVAGKKFLRAKAASAFALKLLHSQ